MLKRSLVIATVISLCLLTAIINLFSPTGIGPVGILILFFSIYTSLLGVVTFLIFYISYLVTYFSTTFTVVRPISRLSFRKSYYYSTVIASAPVMMLALGSVGSVGFYENILIFTFVIIGLIYVSKRV